MSHQPDLQRFLDAQKSDYSTALAEIKRGRKQSHWMWYIFPQIQGLGYSSTSKYYAIKDIDEALAYFNHQILGKRLLEICAELVRLETNDAYRIFGSPDDMKLKSSMTLFSTLPATNSVFQLVLDKFFDGRKDVRTLEILGS
ncbi:MAG TPA: DUF1810 domain-containing protein [Cytophagaceae bacterium]|jgi:uncharacterized protein (DUF1810 family)